MCGNDAVAFGKTGNTVSGLDDRARDLVAEHEWGSWQAIPFEEVAAANAAGVHLQQEFALPYRRKRASLESQVAVVVPHRDAVVSRQRHAR